MARQDHLYVALDKTLCKVVDTCVLNIFENGAPVYETRRDFITKAIQRQIEKEKALDSKLGNKIQKVAKVGDRNIAKQ